MLAEPLFVKTVLTRMIGQRSRAEMYAKEDLSAVEDGATHISLAFKSREEELTDFRIVLHGELFVELGAE